MYKLSPFSNMEKYNLVHEGVRMSSVMDPDEENYDSIYSPLDGKRPPRCNGHNRSCEAWKEDINLWKELIDMDEKKRDIATIGQLDGEPKYLVKTITPSELCQPNGVQILIEFI